MILAAGRGIRMGAITEKIPKPLLSVADKPLIAHQLMRLAQAGIYEIVINLSYLGEQIQSALGDGKKFGVEIQYSHEPIALETGGGIYKALPLLGKDPFLVISGDIWTDYPFTQLPSRLNDHLAHLIMVDNPSYHPKGDFVLQEGKVKNDGTPKLTFASMGIYHPDLFKNCQAQAFQLTKVLYPAIVESQVSGEYFNGDWVNVGTVEEWQKLELLYHSARKSGATTAIGGNV